MMLLYEKSCCFYSMLMLFNYHPSRIIIILITMINIIVIIIITIIIIFIYFPIHLFQLHIVNYHPNRIIIHGESIGGMIACHIAKTYPVDALICDRTFSSLDGTAARLMGTWAGIGLKYCTLWSTNVVQDYLLCQCPKVILQVLIYIIMYIITREYT
jgi:hypothetical protein